MRGAEGNYWLKQVRAPATFSGFVGLLCGCFLGRRAGRVLFGSSWLRLRSSSSFRLCGYRRSSISSSWAGFFVDGCGRCWCIGGGRRAGRLVVRHSGDVMSVNRVFGCFFGLLRECVGVAMGWMKERDWSQKSSTRRRVCSRACTSS